MWRDIHPATDALPDHRVVNPGCVGNEHGLRIVVSERSSYGQQEDFTFQGRPAYHVRLTLGFARRATGTLKMTHRMPPQADGLYDPRYEHDACGVAMVARLDNVPGHDVVVKALEALDNLEHRGAEGADIRTGDGAGILMQLPHRFFRLLDLIDRPLSHPGSLRKT